MPDDGLDLRLLAEQVAVSLIERMPSREPNYRQLVRDWTGGTIYEQGSMVHCDGGLWQATARNANRPELRSAEWSLITDGIRAARGFQDLANPRMLGIALDLTSGRTVDTLFRWPVPIHRGGWVSGDYLEGDEVEHNGATYRAIRDTSEPTTWHDWQLVSARGLQGARGPKGEAGEQGPQGAKGERGETGPIGIGQRGEPGPRGVSPIAIELAPDLPGCIRMVMEDGSVSNPVSVTGMRFVGVYEPGQSYDRGDIVRLSFHLWIAVEDTAEVPSNNSTAWTIFLTGQDPSGVGGQGPSGPSGSFVSKVGGDFMAAPLQIRSDTPAQPTLQFASTTGTVYGGLRGLEVTPGDCEVSIAIVAGGVMQDALAVYRTPGADSTPLVQVRRPPVNPLDIATKGYVDANAGGGIDPNDFVLKAGDAMSGRLTLPGRGTTVGDSPSLAFETADTGFLRQAGGSTIVLQSGGTPIMAWSKDHVPIAADAITLGAPNVAVAGDLDMRAHRITGVLNPADTQDAANKLYVDALINGRLPLTGGNLSGPLVMNTGTFIEVPSNGGSSTIPCIMIGDNQTGFVRAGNNLQLNVSGGLVFTWNPVGIFPNAEIIMSNRRISGLPAPTTPSDAVPRSYVDTLRAQPMTYELAQTTVPGPPNVTTPGDWTQIWSSPYPLPRGGLSRIAIHVAVNLTGMAAGAIYIIGARCTADNLERRSFAYATGDAQSGFNVTLFADVTGTNPVTVVELRCLAGGAGVGGGFTVIGLAGGAARSQVTVNDLGPR